ncbi:MAG: RBBP9/YdeN family alpha/beta hydrolase [Candidatus Kerfeldbacteria bacterium]|jgi:serine hydrolase
MKKVILIHGSYGNPEENWFPWLIKKLVDNDFKVFAPKFPTPLNQSFEAWEEVLSKHIKEIDENTKIVAHSIGVPFVLKIIEKYDLNVSNLFFVSGFLNKLNDKRFDVINETFFKDINCDKCNDLSNQVYIYHSDNDPYVAIKHAIDLSKQLNGSRLTVIKNGGHFNNDSGYTKFPQLLEDILSS